MQLDAEIRTLQEKSDEIRFQMEIWENELTILKEKKELLDDMEEIQRIDDRIIDIEQQLDRWETEQTELLEERGKLISEKKSSDLLTKLERLEGGTTVVDDIKSIAKDATKKVAAAPVTMAVQAVKGGVRSAISKANPFDKQINKNDVTDSGVESIRLAYTSVKKAKNSIKTVSNTVRTTHRTIKTAGKAAKATVKIA